MPLPQGRWGVALTATQAVASLRAFPPETVIAAKFHATVVTGRANKRMKDDCDTWCRQTPSGANRGGSSGQEKSTERCRQVLVFLINFPTEFGRREWTRTIDPHHFKVGKRDFLEPLGMRVS
jgi:hypothetical protein